MRQAPIMLTVACLLTGCVSSPSASFDQHLAGKSDKDARKILAYTCYAEAKWPLHNSSAYKNADGRRRSQMDNNAGSEYRDLVSLCGKMRTAQGETKAALADSCQDLVRERSRKYGVKAADHIQRVADICQRLTGRPVNTGA